MVSDNVSASKIDAIGGNTGNWKTSEINGKGTTTESNEKRHGLGLPDEKSNMVGTGQRGVMAAKVTASDPERDYR
ncbi:MAG: hypothetical protein ABI760_24120 [Ferruginibacter sp.]